MAVAACLAPPAAAGAAPEPAWSIAVSSYPTQFAAGMVGDEANPPGYLVVATNVGGADTIGEFTITDRLPARLGFSTVAGAVGSYGGAGAELTCELLGQTVSCGGAGPLHPGETAWAIVPVSVKAGSSSAVLDRATVSGGGTAGVEARTRTQIGSGVPAFGFLDGSEGMRGAITDADGSTVTLAGAHPYQFRASLDFSTGLGSNGLIAAGGGVRDLEVGLPAGMAVEPGAVGEPCHEFELITHACPAGAQVGTVALKVDLAGSPSVENVAVYEMVPPAGTPVEFGLELTAGVYLHLLGRLGEEGSYRLLAGMHDILGQHPLLGAEVTLWGDPSDAGHDHVRGGCITSGAACPVERTHKAFLTLPGDCRAPLTTMVSADSWGEPGAFVSRSVESPAVDGCGALAFDPALATRPTTSSADSPSGFEVDFHLPHDDDYEGRAEANLRDARVTLPKGMAINPAGVNGRGACSPSQADSVTCPDNAKIGTAEIDTPLLGRPLTGGIYLAQPHQNPFGSLFALYAVVEDFEAGVIVKLASEVTADPVTGQLTASFEDVPQLPLEAVKLDFFEGPRGVLRTPALCGSYSSHATLTPWSGTATVQGASSFSIVASPSGGACATAPGQLPAAPRFDAGSISAAAGGYSPFVVDLSRGDGSQELGALEVTLPEGLVGRLAGTAECADATLAAAAARSGGEEAASPSCPAASRLGRVVARVGAGSSPYPAEGTVYLAGPYRGAPLSLAVVTPAVAGPFDLGTVVVRAAVSVDPTTGRLTIKSDAVPSMLDGVPLDIRSLRIALDRPDLIRNPTSCEPMAITGSATTTLGRVTPLSARFQVGDCAALAFRPKLSLRFSGAIGRNGHPALRAVLRGDPEGAALAGARFTLPGGELLDLRHIRRLCPLAVAAGECPAASRLGSLRLQSPALGAPLSGPVYLRAPRHRLPGLSAEVRSGDLHFILHGRVTRAKGSLGIALQSLPDIPLSRAVLTLAGGRRGILVNSRSLCRRIGRVTAHLAAHNGRHRRLRVRPRRPAECPATRKRTRHS